ncbi:transducin/WD40 repeat-like superfamily protein isoform X2 [Wolffia australiana]
MGGTVLADSSAALLATCGGDTVKLFDLTMESGDPCALSYSPAPGSNVNAVRWNHTNLVVASAGEDKKISLWRKNGQSMGALPLTDADAGDNINESIHSISFSNKGSRYLCSGGSSHIVRIWDLQRKRCIKWLSGHTSTITSVMYNFKDEHLASVSLKGDIIIHSLSTGSRAAELKDPSGQALRILDYSCFSRHIFLTAGDDGSVHLWDATIRSPKMSWNKIHSAPTAGVCFSPSNDKQIVSVGLDKKLHLLDTGSRRPVSCLHHEAPFSSLAIRDDGFILAAGTNTGLVVFYDLRGKPQPLTLLCAYSSVEAVTSLCWQKSKPAIVNENCFNEVALLGSTGEDSVIMPDPLPSSSSSIGAASPGPGSPSVTSQESTPFRSQTWTGGSLLKLHAPRMSSNLKDDMDVFSPLVDVQPIPPSLGKWGFERNEAMKDSLAGDKSMPFSSSVLKTSFLEGNLDCHPISDWRSSSSSVLQENTLIMGSSSALTSELTGISTATRRQPLALSRFVPSTLPDSWEPSSTSIKSSLSGSSFGPSGNLEPSTASSLGVAKTHIAQTNAELLGSSMMSALSSSLPSISKRLPTSASEDLGSSSVKQESSSTGAAAHSGEQTIGSAPFSLQLVQRTLEESLGSLRESIHEDVRNLHIELLRQFHMHEEEAAAFKSSVLEKMDDLLKEVQSLRRENQQLKMLL